LGPSIDTTEALKWVNPSDALPDWTAATCPALPNKAGAVEALRPARGSSLLALGSMADFSGKLTCIFVDIF
jgi:hypothetical protein